LSNAPLKCFVSVLGGNTTDAQVERKSNTHPNRRKLVAPQLIC